VSINQSINQLHVVLAREKPKKGATPKPPYQPVCTRKCAVGVETMYTAGISAMAFACVKAQAVIVL
jgi:hypothetical protein